MGKEKFDKEKDRYQKLFNENKELKKRNNFLEHELERSKKSCDCQKVEKEDKKQEKNVKKQELNTRSNGGDCPKCSSVMIRVDYSKMGDPWVLIRCTNPDCKHRTNEKVK